jgi:methyl-accepting chemotaxis protein
MRNSISFRFNLVTSIMVATLLIVFGVYNHLETESSLYASLDNKMNEVTSRLAQSLPATLWNFETEQLISIVESEVSAGEVKGVFVFDNDNKLVLGRISDESGKVSDSGIPNIITLKKEGLLSFDDEGEEKSVGRFVLLVDTSSIDALLNESMIRTIIQIFVMLFLLITVITILLQRIVIKPLNEIGLALNDIAHGEGDLTRRLNVIRMDEIGVVAHNFNSFSDKIKHTVIKVEEVGKSVNMSSLELSQITEANKQQLESQHMETVQVSTAVNQMSATVLDIASSAEKAAFAAKHADTEAQEGMIMMQSTTESIELLASNVDSAVSVINQLENESQRIGSVIEVIQSIAAQTNLLALNAAIEAARAGEQGRGFAVVADEVRTLASRTQQATEQINQMIEKLQHQSEQAVQVMAESHDNTKRTIEKVGNAAQSLKTIVSSVTEISDMNIQIASAAEQQSAAANEIDQSTVRIASLADESFKSGNQVAESSVNLTKLGNQLNTLISIFKTR